MNSNLTPRLLILAASMAGLMACNTSRQVEQKTEDLQETKNQVAQDWAKLNQEQAEQSAELRQKQQKEMLDEPATMEEVKEAEHDRADLAVEQAKERAELSHDGAERIKDQQEDLAEAKVAVDEKRAELIEDEREKLRDLDERAAKLREKLNNGDESIKDRHAAASALTSFPVARQDAERQIDDLASVSAVKLSAARKRVETQLSKLDDTLDRAESAL